MAKVPGWDERSKRMLAEYGAPTGADAEWADGIIFGTPTRFGNTSAELKAFIDSLGGLWFQGKLNGKAAAACWPGPQLLLKWPPRPAIPGAIPAASCRSRYSRRRLPPGLRTLCIESYALAASSTKHVTSERA